MSPLFPLGSASAPKTTVSLGQLPGYVAPSQAPTKRAPWQSIPKVSYADSATVVLPDDLYRIIWDSVEADVSIPKYAKVIMKLEEVLKGEFFTEYVKKGNVLMISEAEPGIDDCFSLREGTLRLELSRESYERVGLQGVPVPSAGRKHVKSRYLVEINLRLPSMLHGKKGFDRLVWAAQHVLNKSLNWLFLDLNTDVDMQPTGLLSAYHPTIQALSCSKQEPVETRTPSALADTFLKSPAISSEETQESIYDILEYLDMIALASPRVQATDHVDPLLSQYSVSDPTESSSSVRAIIWHGLIDFRWALELLCSIIKHSRIKKLESIPTEQQWLAFSVSSFKSQTTNRLEGYTVLLQPYCEAEQSQDLQDGLAVSTSAEENDVEMDEQENDVSSPGLRESTAIAEARPVSMADKVPRAGFQRFLCAEYADCLK